jgi:chemotaxis response regulator CheB
VRALLIRGEEGLDVIGLASLGEDALEMIARFPPDVVLMDIGLPATEVVEFSPSDEYAQTMALVAKNLQAIGS